MVEGDGFEPPNPEGADLQSAAFSHFATPPLLSSYSIPYDTVIENVLPLKVTKKIMVPARGLEPPTY